MQKTAGVIQTIHGEWKGKEADVFEGRWESFDVELESELYEKIVVQHIKES
jgi:hypothetical protein